MAGQRTNSKSYKTSTCIGFVKQVVDENFAGRLLVWIPEFESRETDESGWILCNYCSPFAGSTNWADNTQGSDAQVTSFEGTQTSYGMWMIPPDINNEVVVIFPFDDQSRALWIGCIYKEYMNYDVPAVPYNDRTEQFKGQEVPGANYNKYDKEKFTTPIDAARRPYHKTKFEGVSSQGLIKDKIRGITDSSAQRDTISQVFGISTPGKESAPGVRTGGHSFVMDDKDGSEHILFATKSGSQIRVDETNELIYFINKPGTAWVQLDKDGNVDIFAAKSISMRTQEDFNLRADRNINIEAGQNIFMKAAKDTDADLKIVGEDAGLGGDIFIQALNNLHTTVDDNVYLTVNNGNVSIDVKKGTKDEFVKGDTRFTTDGNLDVTAKAGSRHTTDGNYDLLASGDINFDGTNIGSKANAETNIQSTGNTNLLGALVNINSGGGSPGSAEANKASPQDALTKDMGTRTNNLAEFEDENKFVRKTEEIKTTTQRFMTFEPCPEHRNKGGQ